MLSTLGGAAAGAALLAGVGAGISYVSSAKRQCPPGNKCHQEAALVGAALGWMVGAPVGAWLGSSRRIGLLPTVGASVLTVAALGSVLMMVWFSQPQDTDTPTFAGVLAPVVTLGVTVAVGLHTE